MKRTGVILASVLLPVLVLACGQQTTEPAGSNAPEEPAPSASATPAAPPAAAAPAATAAPPAPAPPALAAAVAVADGGLAATGAARTIGPFEPSGEPLALAGLALPAEGARPYLPLGVPFAAVSALLDATPGLRVRDHVGFYPPRPIDLTGRPAPYTFGYVNALSRPGTWKPTPDATFVLVPFHHTEPSLAIYAPAGEGMVRFVTRVDLVPCEEEEHELGFVLTRRADELQVIRTCGAQAEVTTYRAEGGRLAGSVQSVDPSAVRPPAE